MARLHSLRWLTRALAATSALALLACADPAAELAAQLEAGETALAAGEPGQAVQAFKGALQTDPNSTEAHYGLARAYLIGGRARQAQWELAETVRLAPDHYPARIQLSRLLGRGSEEDREAAVAHAQHVIDAESLAEDDPQRWVAWLAKGRALEALGRHDEARAAYETSVELAPDEGAPRFVLARFLEDRGDRAEAEIHYRGLVEREPGIDALLTLARFLGRERSGDAEAEALHRRAVAEAGPDQQVAAQRALAGFLFARGRADEAIRSVEAALAEHEGSPELVAMLAALHHANGDLDAAEATLAEAAARAPGEPGPALQLADFRRARGDLEGALEAAEQAIAAGGGSDARLRKAELLIQSAFAGGPAERRAQGRAIVDAELARDEGHPEARLVRGWLELAEGRSEEAASSARRALDRRPEWPRAHVLLGRALADQGELRGARAEYERALALDPSNLETRRGLAQLLVQAGDPEAAIAHGRAVLRANPDDQGLRLLVAEALNATGRRAEAAEEIARIPGQARSAEALYAQGQLQAAAGDVAGGRATLLRALEMDPHRAEILAALFEIDQRTGRAGDTLARVNAALGVRPDDARLHRLAGRASMALGRHESAERSLRKAIELAPNDLKTYGVLAQHMVESGQQERLIESYEQAVAANPEIGVLRATLARLLEAAGREEEAITAYQEALARDPGLAVAMNNLAWLLAERGRDLDDALDLAQEAKARLPDLAETADTLGWVLYKKGIPSAAIGYFQEAERLLPPDHPQRVLVRLHLARALQANGEFGKARTVVDDALASLPESADAAPIQAELRALRDALPEAS